MRQDWTSFSLALLNDITAASGSVGTLTAATVSLSSANKPSIEERLATLEGLRERGLVSDVEVDRRRNSILDEI
jgi:hypothetical protein